jgi:hypothetical protein
MAFLRFTRDKRGYENFCLVQPSQRRGLSSARVLYWFRSPPNVKVGREPFDEHIRRELEAQNPDVTFDWRRILETPIPSADAEMWRERRRVERAAKAVRRADAEELQPGDEVSEREPPSDDEAVADAPVHVLEAAAAAAESPLDSSVPPDLSLAETSNETVDQTNGESTRDAPVELRTVGSSDSSRRKGRRRRRRRGRSGPEGSGGGPPAGPAGVV